MRCPDCSKFTGLDFGEPECDLVEVTADGEVSAEVRLFRTCAECGQEMKEANLSLTGEMEKDDVKAHSGEGHELDARESSVDQIEEGGGRYAKSYFGAEVKVEITCACQKDVVAEVTMSDKVAASEMEELV